jgi:PncC family amidohydrolase
MLKTAQNLGGLLLGKRLSLSVAESCTGGMMGAAITRVPGSSAYFKGGIIAYSNEIKEKVLGVSPELLKTKGAVSREVVIAMAKGGAKVCAASCCIALSGIAGPDGGSEDKPVGLIWIGICAGEQVKSFKYNFSGDREKIRKEATKAGIKKMIEVIGDG